MRATKIGVILNKLMSAQNLNVSELARQSKLPQPTVHRIASGTCNSPHISTLQPLADFFTISIDQLKGLEPIPLFDNISKIPVISWELSTSTQIPGHANYEHVVADVPVNPQSYALKVIDGAMEPFFPKGTLLIVDPLITPKDGSYVIARTHASSTSIFRQLIINGTDKLLKPLNPDTKVYKLIKLKKSDAILATVVQARWTYLD